MKKLISIISALTIAVSMLMPAAYAANTDDTMKSVLESVKERVEIPDECTEFSSGTRTFYGVTLYYFSWNSKDTDKYRYVNIECYDNGIINSYNTESDFSYDGTPKLPTISKEEAKKSAEDFIKSVNPDFPYEIKITDRENGSLYSNGYSFDTKVYVNGVPFDEASGYISVSGDNGNVLYFNLGYTPMEFPSVKDAINSEDAKKAYSEKLGLKLIYRIYTDDDGNDIAYPVYVQKYDYSKYINALTGEIEDRANENVFSYKLAGGADITAEDAGVSRSELSEKEIEELENVSGLISQADIEKQIRSNKTLNIPQSVNVTAISLSKSYKKDIYTYSISMSDEKTRIYLSANAQNGEIIRYSRYDSDIQNDSAALHNDSVFKALAGSKADEYRYNEETCSYDRYVNDINVSGDNAFITYSGDVLTGYSISYTDSKFSSIENVMSVSDAEKVMFDKDGYEIKYISKATDTAIEAVPVYVHNPVSINPFSGAYVDYRNEEIQKGGVTEYSDIDGHYAEKYIRELAYYGVGFEGGEFKPDEKITQKDFLALLTAVYQSGVIVMKENAGQTAEIYRNSFRNSIITEDERNDNAPVTREAAAIYMIRAIGAESYAKYNDIYVSPFKDVNENKGYIALLSAMGVAGGDGDGNFNPEREITRAESIVMIYNYLTR